jgi:glyoxylate reductase
MKVYITRKIPEVGVHLLKDIGYEVIINPDDCPLTPEALVSEIHTHNPDALISMLTDSIQASVFDAAPNVKIVANYAVGYNNIDLEEAKKRNIVVSNTPDVLTDAVAEHTIALMLAIGRRVVESDTFIRKGMFTCWEPLGFLGTQLRGSVLGLIGAGRIGGRVAEIAKNGFGMTVCYYDVKRNEQFEKTTNALFCATPDKVLKNADFVSIHVPLLETTKHMIDAAHLRMMKKTAYLINTSRGQIVKEADLVEALRLEHIRGAALDVFEEEPRLAAGLTELSNVVITPHTASATTKAREDMSEMAARNVIEVLRGNIAPNAVTIA